MVTVKKNIWTKGSWKLMILKTVMKTVMTWDMMMILMTCIDVIGTVCLMSDRETDRETDRGMT